MRRLLVLLVFLPLLAGCARNDAAPAPTDAPAPDAGIVAPEDFTYPSSDTLRLATWNLQHFVDAYDDPYVDTERENTGARMEGRIEQFVEAVRAMNPDVLVLQEVESEAFVRALVEERMPEAGYRFFGSIESPTWYMNVVVMSRLPLGVIDSYADVTTPIVGQTTEDGAPAAQSLTNHRLFTVDVLARPDYLLSVTGAHLKAGRDARDQGWRIGQIRFLHAEYARRLAANPDANLVVAGDLNALADSPELRLLLNNDRRPAPDSLRRDVDGWTARFDDPLHGSDTFTHPSDAPARQLDYVLVGHNAAPELISTRVAQPLPPEAMAATSDHLPVVATFTTRDQ